MPPSAMMPRKRYCPTTSSRCCVAGAKGVVCLGSVNGRSNGPRADRWASSRLSTSSRSVSLSPHCCRKYSRRPASFSISMALRNISLAAGSHRFGFERSGFPRLISASPYRAPVKYMHMRKTHPVCTAFFFIFLMNPARFPAPAVGALRSLRHPAVQPGPSQGPSTIGGAATQPQSRRRLLVRKSRKITQFHQLGCSRIVLLQFGECRIQCSAARHSAPAPSPVGPSK